MCTCEKLIPQPTCALTLLELRFELTSSARTQTPYAKDLISIDQEIVGTTISFRVHLVLRNGNGGMGKLMKMKTIFG